MSADCQTAQVHLHIFLYKNHPVAESWLLPYQKAGLKEYEEAVELGDKMKEMNIEI